MASDSCIPELTFVARFCIDQSSANLQSIVNTVHTLCITTRSRDDAGREDHSQTRSSLIWFISIPYHWSPELSILREHIGIWVLTLKNYSWTSRLIEKRMFLPLQEFSEPSQTVQSYLLWSWGWSSACKPPRASWGVKVWWKHLRIKLFKNSQVCQETESGLQDQCWEGGRQERQQTHVLQHQRHKIVSTQALCFSTKVIFPQN